MVALASLVSLGRQICRTSSALIRPNSRSSSFDRSSSSCRQHQPHLDDQVAAAAVARRRHAALAQPEPLSRLRARRHPQPGRAVERRHLDLRAERRLVDRDRHRQVQVVAVARGTADAARTCTSM